MNIASKPQQGKGIPFCNFVKLCITPIQITLKKHELNSLMNWKPLEQLSAFAFNDIHTRKRKLFADEDRPSDFIINNPRDRFRIQ